jgi:hypothetical protein
MCAIKDRSWIADTMHRIAGAQSWLISLLLGMSWWWLADVCLLTVNISSPRPLSLFAIRLIVGWGTTVA